MFNMDCVITKIIQSINQIFFIARFRLPRVGLIKLINREIKKQDRNDKISSYSGMIKKKKRCNISFIFMKNNSER